MKLTKKQTGELVKACVKNDRIAQGALYKLYYADMLRVCNSYLPDKELAREAFNSGFLKVFQSIQNFDPEKGELGGWIRKIMIGTSIDLCRKELKFNHVSTELPEEEEPFLSPDILEKLYFQDVLQNIRTLPYATQTVFNLSVIDGFSHKEIGEQLNISEGTSRWHLSEAKKLLRALLETTGNERSKEGRGERK
jgi:RNA polymerase sigma factor (sigma-70 family)